MPKLTFCSKPLYRTLFVVLWFSILLHAQEPVQSIKAASVAFGGKIQLQKEGERVWKKINRKIRIENGDLIKSGYKSYLIIRVGTANQIILGSNSKVLIKLPTENSTGPAVVSVTVFEGGCYVTWKGPEEIQYFSNDGMAASSNATFAFLYEKTSGKTHVISTREKMMVQNITKKTPVEINKGEFTFIIPEHNPKEPALITTEISDLMRKFFGDKFVSKELDEANIKVASTSTKAIAEKAETKKEFEESIRVTPLFNMSKVVQTIRKHERDGTKKYIAPYWVDEMLNHKFYFESRFTYLSASKGQSASYNGLKVRAGLSMGNLSMAFNVPYETNNEDTYTLAASGTQGILDKIYYLDYVTPKKSLFLHFGELRDVTFNEGLLVNKFSNELRSQIAQPMGMYLNWDLTNFITWKTIIADVSLPQVLGSNFLYENGYTSIGASLMFDLDQAGGLTKGDGRNNFRGENEVATDSTSQTETLWGWDVYLNFNFIQQENLNAFGYVGWSQLHRNGFGINGTTFQFPGIEVYWDRYKFFLEGLVSLQNSHHEYFNNFYMEDRSRIFTLNGNSTAVAQADRHPPMGLTNGFEVGSEIRLLQSLWFGLSYGQTILVNEYVNLKRTNYEVKLERGDPIIISDADRGLYSLNANRTMNFRLFGGNNLVSGLKRFEIYYELSQGQFGREMIEVSKVFSPDTSFMPTTGGLVNQELNVVDTIFSNTVLDPDTLVLELEYDNYYPNLSNTKSDAFFFSLATMFGVRIEYGVFKTATVLAEFRGFSHDFAGNGIYDDGDLLSEFSLAWRQKF